MSRQTENENEPASVIVNVWDYLPSPVAKQFIQHCRAENILGDESQIAIRQQSVECGYIAAAHIIYMLNHNRALTRGMAEALAEAAMDNVPVYNQVLAMRNADSPQASECARYLEILEVLHLIAAGLQTTLDQVLNETRIKVGILAEVKAIIATKKLEQREETEYLFVAVLTAAEKEDGGYVADSHFFTACVEFRKSCRNKRKNRDGPVAKKSAKTTNASSTRKRQSDIMTYLSGKRPALENSTQKYASYHISQPVCDRYRRNAQNSRCRSLWFAVVRCRCTY